MNFVGLVIKSCEARRASFKIWLNTNQLYPGELFTLLFSTYIYVRKKAGHSKLLKLLVFFLFLQYSKQWACAVIIVKSWKSSHRIEHFRYSIGSSKGTQYLQMYTFRNKQQFKKFHTCLFKRFDHVKTEFIFRWIF